MAGQNGNSRSIRKAPTTGEVVERRELARLDEEHDGPSAADLERFSSVTRTCPACGKEVHDDAEVCYHCGEAMNAPEHQRPTDWRAVVVIALVILLALGLIWGLR